MGRTPSVQLAEVHALTRQLLAVAERARADFADVVGQVGLTPQQARTLLWLEEPSAMSGLAEHLGCDASNVTGLADRLEGRGLVERVVGSDRRVKLLRLTRAGQRLRTRLADRVARGSTVGARLDHEDRARLATILDRMLTDPGPPAPGRPTSVTSSWRGPGGAPRGGQAR